MKNKDVIKLLDEEVRLAIIEEDENEDGKLYISKAQLKKAENVLNELKNKRNEAKNWVEELKKIVQGNERFNIIPFDELILKDKIFLDHKKLIITGKHIIITSCTFYENTST